MAQVVTVGEGMLELSGGADHWRLANAGDVLNTTIQLARLGHKVAFLTAVGTDPFSDSMLEQWQAEQVDTSLVLRNPLRRPGLYAVTTAPDGERSFTYWRETSAARTVFDLPGTASAVEFAARCDLLFFSLISLAILPLAGRRALLDLAARVRASGGEVAFDGNYRPALWPDVEQAITTREAAISLASIGLPTLDDEQALCGPSACASIAERWTRLGCSEVVVKLGPKGCMIPGGAIVPPPKVLVPVDTSGAGDAFDAGYLSARLLGASPSEAARRGHDLAGWAIMHRGAVPPVMAQESP